MFSVHVTASAKEGSYTGEIIFKTLHEARLLFFVCKNGQPDVERNVMI